MRYVKPDAGGLAIAANKTLTFGDYLGAIGLSLFQIASLVVGITLAITINILFVLLVFGALPVLALQIEYYRGSVTIGSSYRGDPRVNEAIKIYSSIHGSFTESYARPIVKKIFTHAQVTEDHSSIWGGCESCRDRIYMLQKLVPSNSLDDSDMLAAKQFLAARKELKA